MTTIRTKIVYSVQDEHGYMSFHRTGTAAHLAVSDQTARGLLCIMELRIKTYADDICVQDDLVYKRVYPAV